MPELELHVKIREEDGAYWATVDEYPGVLATGDDLEELRESLEEGIAMMKADGGDAPIPAFRLSKLRVAEVREAPASADLIPA